MSTADASRESGANTPTDDPNAVKGDEDDDAEWAKRRSERSKQRS